MENEPLKSENQRLEQPISVGNWIITILIMAIPLLNLIMLFVWGFGGNNSPNSKANWAKATLIWIAIGVVIWLFIALLFGGLMFMES